MPEGTLGLYYKIATDPSQAIQGTEQFGAAGQRVGNALIELNRQLGNSYGTLAASLKQLGYSAQEAGNVYRKFGAQGKAAAEELEQAYGQSAAAVQDANTVIAQSQQGVIDQLYASTTAMRHFRALFSATLGLASFGFWFIEWGHMLDDIKTGIQYMEGFGAAAQTALQKLINLSRQAEVEVGGLTTASKIASLQMLITSTNAQITTDIATRSAITARSYWSNLREELVGIGSAITGNVGPLAMFASQFPIKAAATTDELQKNLLLQKQLEELVKLQKQLAEEKKKDARADAAAYNREVALARAGYQQMEMQFRMAKAQDALDEKLANSLTARMRAVSAEFEQQTRLGEETLRIQSGIQGKGLKAGTGGSEQWMAATAREGLQAAARQNKEMLNVMQMEPGALAEIEHAYPGLTLAQLAALRAVQQVTKAWKEQQRVMLNPNLDYALARQKKFEDLAPAWAGKWAVAFGNMKSAQQQLILGVLSLGNG